MEPKYLAFSSTLSVAANVYLVGVLVEDFLFLLSFNFLPPVYSSNHPQNRWNMKFCCDKETDLRKLKVESVWSKQTPGFFGILTGFWNWKHSTLDVWMTCEVWFRSSFYPRILATPAKGTGAWSSSQTINGPKIGWTSACESSWVCRNHSDAFWCWVCHVSTTRISLRPQIAFQDNATRSLTIFLMLPNSYRVMG